MPAFTKLFDTQIAIYQRRAEGPSVGLSSSFDESPFPTTGKTIDGFSFDDRRWGGQLDDNEAHFVPVLWDPSMAGVEDNIVTGIGDRNDLLVTAIQSVEDGPDSVWRPRVLHGFYYSEDEEFYLYSDDGVIDVVQVSGLAPPTGITASGGNLLQLSYVPKTGTPIIARGYEWNRTDGVYLPDRDVRKMVEFTGKFTPSGQQNAQDGSSIFWQNVNTADEEWYLDTTTSPPTAVFNQQVSNQIGDFYVNTSGLDSIQLDELDTLGVSDGTNNQQFNFTYSPIDRTAPFTLYSDFLGGDHRIYTVVSDFTLSGVDQVKIDWDLGLATFGTTVSGGVPPYGSNLRAGYHKTIGLEYEPTDSRDYVQDSNADLNPVRRFTGDGFVFLRNRVLDVSQLQLTALLPEISTNFFGPLFLGNNFATIQATALTKDNEVVEGQEVTFEILDVEIGSFGSSQSTSAITNGRGQARTLYNPPRTIEQLGAVTDDVSSTASGTDLFLTDFQASSASDTLFLFQVAREDLILGIPKSGLKNYYETFLTEEDFNGPSIDFDLDPTGNFAWLGSAVEEQIKWEVWHREVHSLAVPLVYGEEDLRTGKKTVVSEIDPLAVNPHTGDVPAIVPVQPTSITITDSGTGVTFDSILPDVTASSIQKSYLIVGPTKVRMRAKTLNTRTNTTIFSNTIEILIDIPDASKGLFDIDTINSVPSGTLTNAHYYDQEGTTLEHVELLQSGLLPIGWRLRSPSITLASALDGVTFLDLNPIPQAYTHDLITTVSGLTTSGMLINLGHEFEVTI